MEVGTTLRIRIVRIVGSLLLWAVGASVGAYGALFIRAAIRGSSEDALSIGLIGVGLCSLALVSVIGGCLSMRGQRHAGQTQ